VKAREAFEGEGRTVDYRDVVENQDFLDEMTEITGGKQLVPVIVDGEKVKIGYGGT